MPSPDRKSIPLPIEIRALPSLAKVAYAARCARRVLPLFKHFWPDAPTLHVHGLADMVDRLQDYAGNPRIPIAADTRGEDAADAVIREGRSEALWSIALAAAKVARTADNLRSDAEEAVMAVTNASRSGYEAHRAARAFSEAAGRALAAATWRDYELLRLASERERWTDDTPVPPEFFGPLWPDGEPEGWPIKAEEPAAPRKLILQIAVPEDVPDDELVETVAKLVEAASALHAAYGGSGLIVNDQRVYEPSDVPAEVDA